MASTRTNTRTNPGTITSPGEAAPTPHGTARSPVLAERAADHARRMIRLQVPAVQARYRAVFGRATRSSNKPMLIERISLELARREQTESSAGSLPSPRDPGGRFGSKSIDELRELYEATVGRPTKSVDRGYLEWKIREAEQGRVTLGPRTPRGPLAEGGAATTLPWRLPRALVEAMDEGWRRHGFRTRSALLAAAVGELFERKGEHALARRFGIGGDAE